MKANSVSDDKEHEKDRKSSEKEKLGQACCVI
jgi:hypothetical protein